MSDPQLLVIRDRVAITVLFVVLFFLVFASWKIGDSNRQAIAAEQRLSECRSVNRSYDDHLNACHDSTGRAWVELEGVKHALRMLVGGE